MPQQEAATAVQTGANRCADPGPSKGNLSPDKGIHMKHSALPTHPFMRHPHTGDPLRAVGILATGRIVWPIMGASPDDDDAGGAAGGAAGAAGGTDTGKADKGFPANTPVTEMTAEQQAAYWRDKSQLHEGRNKDLLKITGGKYGEDLQADLSELGTLRDKTRTDSERELEAAKNAAKAEVRQDLGTDSARMAFEFALGHDPENNDQSDLIETLDLTKVLTDDGKVDTAKVRAVVAKIAPTGKGKGGTAQDADYGAGRRRGEEAKSGQSGVSEADRRFGKPKTDA